MARELQFIQTLAHPNIVQFLGMAKNEEGQLYVVCEWAAKGDLRRYLYGSEEAIERTVSWEQRCVMLLDIAQAVFYLHSRRVVHRDIKAENCLLTTSLTVKLCDFGLSRVIDEEAAKMENGTAATRDPSRPKKLSQMPAALRMSMAGTDEFMAPEVVLGQSYGVSADVFSFGITMSEVALRKKPRPRLPQEYFEFPESEFAAQLPPEAPAGLLELTVKCCTLDPPKRPDMSSVVKTLSDICDREQAVKSPRGNKGAAPSPPSSPRRMRPAMQLASIQSVAIEKKK